MRSGNYLSTLCWKTAATAFIALLSACTTMPVRIPEVAQHGGYVLHDENTTPRFQHLGRPPGATIGTLYPDGSNVFLDGRQVTANTSIRNGAHVRTGPDSGALVALEQAIRDPCRIEIQDIIEGRILGNTAKCQHVLETPQGSGRAETMPTEYHVGVSGIVTELTILSGRMEVWLKSDSTRRATVNRFQEVLLTPDAIVGPRPVSQTDIEDRTRWRKKFKFHKQSPNYGAIGAGAAALGILWYLLERSDDDDEPPPSDDTGSQDGSSSSGDTGSRDDVAPF